MNNMPELFEHSQWIYERSCDNRYRYVLGEHGKKPLVCIGVNPSTAEPDNLDPTLRQVKSRAKQLGYDGWIMLNLYPQRETIPYKLDAELNIEEHRKHHDCLVEKLLWEFDFGKMAVWAGWGTSIERRKYLMTCLYKMIESVNFLWPKIRWIHIGHLSKSGHPHHPLYLPKNAEVKPFDINAYLKGLNNADGSQ